MDMRHFETLRDQLKAILEPTVKKILRITIKENLSKEKDFQVDLLAILDELENHYATQPKIMFEEIRKQMMVDGLRTYSGYVEPKIDD